MGVSDRCSTLVCAFLLHSCSGKRWLNLNSIQGPKTQEQNNVFKIKNKLRRSIKKDIRKRVFNCNDT